MSPTRTHRTAFPPLVAIVLATGLVIACGEPRNHSRAAFVLIDISTDYAAELDKAQALSRYLLGRLEGGDSLAIAFIDNSSFTELNYIARADFDHRPSVATRQKWQVSEQLDAFVERFRVPSAHSDISGGVLLATDFLDANGAGEKVLFILSDLHEDLPPWLERDMAPDLDGIRVVAVNVKRQRSDNNDPGQYRRRLAHWQQHVEENGGQWQVINDLARLDRVAALH